MKIEWDERMSVGEDAIDSQHKKLLTHLNKLIENIATESEVMAVRETLEFLKNYIDEHFTYEEKYMQEYDYPGLYEHKKVHQEFVIFLQKFREDFEAVYSEGEAVSVKLEALAEKAQKFLGDWFVRHILGDDMGYRDYISNK
jgi:hemerythrin